MYEIVSAPAGGLVAVGLASSLAGAEGAVRPRLRQGPRSLHLGGPRALLLRPRPAVTQLSAEGEEFPPASSADNLTLQCSHAQTVGEARIILRARSDCIGENLA